MAYEGTLVLMAPEHREERSRGCGGVVSTASSHPVLGVLAAVTVGWAYAFRAHEYQNTCCRGSRGTAYAIEFVLTGGAHCLVGPSCPAEKT